jgi:nucleotide-binding universal stress UspA family protein
MPPIFSQIFVYLRSSFCRTNENKKHLQFQKLQKSHFIRFLSLANVIILIKPSWDVLHGEAGDAICRYVNGMEATLLAMTSHARGGLERALLGSVAATCIRKAGVPMLIIGQTNKFTQVIETRRSR